MKTFGAAMLLLAVTIAQADPCKERDAGACFVVHGRLSYYDDGKTLRIWPIGSKTLMAVRDAQLSDAVASHMSREDSQTFADFTVCPLAEKQPGVMQPVCIQSVDKPAFVSKASGR